MNNNSNNNNNNNNNSNSDNNNDCNKKTSRKRKHNDETVANTKKQKIKNINEHTILMEKYPFLKEINKKKNIKTVIDCLVEQLITPNCFSKYIESVCRYMGLIYFNGDNNKKTNNIFNIIYDLFVIILVKTNLLSQKNKQKKSINAVKEEKRKCENIKDKLSFFTFLVADMCNSLYSINFVTGIKEIFANDSCKNIKYNIISNKIVGISFNIFDEEIIVTGVINNAVCNEYKHNTPPENDTNLIEKYDHCFHIRVADLNALINAPTAQEYNELTKKIYNSESKFKCLLCIRFKRSVTVNNGRCNFIDKETIIKYIEHKIFPALYEEGIFYIFKNNLENKVVPHFNMKKNIYNLLVLLRYYELFNEDINEETLTNESNKSVDSRNILFCPCENKDFIENFSFIINYEFPGNTLFQMLIVAAIEINDNVLLADIIDYVKKKPIDPSIIYNIIVTIFWLRINVTISNSKVNNIYPTEKEITKTFTTTLFDITHTPEFSFTAEEIDNIVKICNEKMSNNINNVLAFTSCHSFIFNEKYNVISLKRKIFEKYQNDINECIFHSSNVLTTNEVNNNIIRDDNDIISVDNDIIGVNNDIISVDNDIIGDDNNIITHDTYCIDKSVLFNILKSNAFCKCYNNTMIIILNIEMLGKKIQYNHEPHCCDYKIQMHCNVYNTTQLLLSQNTIEQKDIKYVLNNKDYLFHDFKIGVDPYRQKLNNILMEGEKFNVLEKILLCYLGYDYIALTNLANVGGMFKSLSEKIDLINVYATDEDLLRLFKVIMIYLFANNQVRMNILRILILNKKEDIINYLINNIYDAKFDLVGTHNVSFLKKIEHFIRNNEFIKNEINKIYFLSTMNVDNVRNRDTYFKIPQNLPKSYFYNNVLDNKYDKIYLLSMVRNIVDEYINSYEKTVMFCRTNVNNMNTLIHILNCILYLCMYCIDNIKLTDLNFLFTQGVIKVDGEDYKIDYINPKSSFQENFVTQHTNLPRVFTHKIIKDTTQNVITNKFNKLLYYYYIHNVQITITRAGINIINKCYTTPLNENNFTGQIEANQPIKLFSNPTKNEPPKIEYINVLVEYLQKYCDHDIKVKNQYVYELATYLNFIHAQKNYVNNGNLNMINENGIICGNINILAFCFVWLNINYLHEYIFSSTDIIMRFICCAHYKKPIY